MIVWLALLASVWAATPWPSDWHVAWSPAQLQAVEAIIGDAQVVGLGESIHTVGGFADARAQLIEHLVRERGFRAVALETPWLRAKVAEDYVARCHGSAVHAMRSVFLVFDDVRMVELLQFLCGWNQAHPDDPVRLLAFDVQDFERAAAVIDSAQPSEDMLRCLPEHPTPSDAVTCLDVIRTAPAAPPRIELARRTVRTLHEGIVVRGASERNSVRDHGMADALLARIAHDAPGARVVAWAHNMHLSHGLKVPTYAAGTMGDFLREALGDDYVAIAFVGHEVGLAWDWLPRVRPPRPSATSTRLAAKGPLVVDDLTDSWWDTPRATGRARYVDVRRGWDGLVHLAHARPGIGVSRLDRLIDHVDERKPELCWLNRQYGHWSRERLQALVARGLVAAGATEREDGHWQRDETVFDVDAWRRGRRWCARLSPVHKEPLGRR